MFADRVIDQSQRLTQAGTAPRWQGNLVVAALMIDLVPAPHLPADLDDLTGAPHRCVERHTVEPLHHLWSRGPDTQPEAAVGDVVQAGGRHRQKGRCPGVNREDARPQFDGRGFGGEITQLAHRVEGVRLGHQGEVDALLLQDANVVDGLTETARIIKEYASSHIPVISGQRNRATIRSSCVTAGASGSGNVVRGNVASGSANSRYFLSPVR